MPHATQSASAASTAASSCSRGSVGSHSTSTSTPRRRAECGRDSLVARCGVNVGSKSPTTTILNVCAMRQESPLAESIANAGLHPIHESALMATRCVAFGPHFQRSSCTAIPVLERSPLTDSNRRPPPYHALRSATGRNRCNGLACFGRFRGLSICHRLPLVAPARLHKRSIPVAGISDEKSDSAPSRSQDTGLTPSV